jgi:hypothetical protein
MHLGGVTIDETGDVRALGPIHLGDFNNGDVKSYPHDQGKFIGFDLTEGRHWPKSYLAIWTLSEIDSHHGQEFVDYVRKLYIATRDHVRMSLEQAAADGGILQTVGEILGQVAGALLSSLAGEVITKIIDYFAQFTHDVIFTPVMSRATLTGPHDRFNGSVSTPLRSRTFRGFDGEYRVTYRWWLEDMTS